MVETKQPTLEELRIGERVKKHRIMRGLTQTELARRLGVTPGAVSRFESGDTMIGIGTLLDIVAILDICIEDMLPEYSLKTRYSEFYQLMEEIPSERRTKLIDCFTATLQAVKG